VTGTLVLVATPIGNLAELSPRAVEVLGSADVIACEDTRRTGRLLAHAGIAKPRLLVVNDHTEAAAT
jgi:16S rRNA (cytidine1402-2'-O)-methyltransferase